MSDIKLSVIIVNYNVKYFLEQALYAVRKAAERLPCEVWVVDNNSADDSVDMLRRQFPEVKLIANTQNTGFSVANNQAIALAQGEYVLLLNPDTVVREDTFEKTVAFMEAHPQAGGLGVRMIDGRGYFLPESKRGFPSPEVAFYKAFGLSKIFPRSERFNRYHLGYLSEHEIHEVEVLSGAFMLMRRSVLEEIGYLDEAFFMYGEDIDLSYRIVQAGYKNYYYPNTTIIHYKGESTKKGSLNYVKTFYQAMIIFARKHFGQHRASWALILMLQLAIYFRATLSLLRAWMAKLFLPLSEAGLLYGGLVLLANFWSNYRYDEPDYFQPTFYQINLPLYALVWVLAIYWRGGYDRNSRPGQLVEGWLWGSVAIALVYAFLPQDFRASRMLLLLGSAWALAGLNAWRWLLQALGLGRFGYGHRPVQNLAIIGSMGESHRVQQLLYQAQIRSSFVGTIAPDSSYLEQEKGYMGSMEQLTEMVALFKIQELVFCGRDLSAERIIHWMSSLGPDLQYKILPEHSLSIIGSNSKDSAGELYTVELQFKISTPMARRNKRLFDVLSTLFILLTWPFWWLIQAPGLGWGLWLNTWAVLLGRRSWQGYEPKDSRLRSLPPLSPGVLYPCDGLSTQAQNEETLHRLNILYAKDYHWLQDLQSLWRNRRLLGRR